MPKPAVYTLIVALLILCQLLVLKSDPSFDKSSEATAISEIITNTMDFYEIIHVTNVGSSTFYFEVENELEIDEIRNYIEGEFKDTKIKGYDLIFNIPNK